MPKKLHDKLIAEAKIKYPGDKKKQDRYIWGTLRKIEGQNKKGRK